MAHRPEVIAKWLSVDEVATILGVSSDTVTRLFENADDVIDLGTPETLHKRRKRLLRISRQALDKFIAAKQVNQNRKRVSRSP